MDRHPAWTARCSGHRDRGCGSAVHDPSRKWLIRRAFRSVQALREGLVMKTSFAWGYRTTAAGAAALLLFAVVACGSSSSADRPEDTPNAAPATPAATPEASAPTPEAPAADAAVDRDAATTPPTNEYCERVANAKRGIYDTCCTSPADKNNSVIQFSVAYVEAERNLCNRIVGLSTATGRMVAGPTQAACWAALASFSSVSCATWKHSNIDSSSCKGAYVGTVAMGGACAEPDECMAGLTCLGYVYKPAKDGTCARPAAIGQTCGGAVVGSSQSIIPPLFGDHLDCEPGLYCNDEGTCAVRTPLDGACGGAPSCIEGAICRAGVCAGLGTEGSACNVSNTQCARPLVCRADGTCGAAGVAGESCTSPNQCEGSCTSGQCASLCGSN
jgi:hypothetical protein